MSKSQVGPGALLIAFVAAALALMLLPGTFAWLSSIGGLVLVFILLAYDGEGYRSVFESLAFAAVFAFCLMLASAVLLRALAESQVGTQGSEALLAHNWLPLVWLAVTVIFWPIDRARMSGRAPQAAFGRATLLGPPPASAQIPVAATQPFPVAATVVPSAPPLPHSPPTPPPARQPIWQPVPTPSIAPEPAPRIAPVVVPEPKPVPPAPSQVAPAPAPVVPPPNAVPVSGGKRTMIYVTLVGEGLNMLRSVEAEHMGRDFYRIVEPMPESEIWEYRPGQVVRCKKQNLSSGKALVAIEEAPRAQ